MPATVLSTLSDLQAIHHWSLVPLAAAVAQIPFTASSTVALAVPSMDHPKQPNWSVEVPVCTPSATCKDTAVVDTEVVGVMAVSTLEESSRRLVEFPRPTARRHPSVLWLALATTWPIQAQESREPRKCTAFNRPRPSWYWPCPFISSYSRLLTAKYADGVSVPTRSVTGDELPNARLISLQAFGDRKQEDPRFTIYNMQWGQIMTHDMSLQFGGSQASEWKNSSLCDSL